MLSMKHEVKKTIDKTDEGLAKSPKSVSLKKNAPKEKRGTLPRKTENRIIGVDENR